MRTICRPYDLYSTKLSPNNNFAAANLLRPWNLLRRISICRSEIVRREKPKVEREMEEADAETNKWKSNVSNFVVFQQTKSV